MIIQELNKIIATEKDTINYLAEVGVLSLNKKCYKCKAPMKFDYNTYLFTCQKKGHKVRSSIFKNTFFSLNKLGVNNVLLIVYFYLHKASTTEICKMTGFFSESVTAWCQYLRELLADSLDFTDILIGGEDVVVEIDETKLGKRKYHRGHIVDGVWVVGGIERTEEKKCFYVKVPDRTADSIYSVISNFVLPGSIIYTDKFKSYIEPCKVLNHDHFTVNHSKNFVDPITGTHTNTIEGLNNGLKHIIKPRNRTEDNIDSWLFYFIFRRQNNDNIWLGFIKALKSVKYID